MLDVVLDKLGTGKALVSLLVDLFKEPVSGVVGVLDALLELAIIIKRYIDFQILRLFQHDSAFLFSRVSSLALLRHFTLGVAKILGLGFIFGLVIKFLLS